MANRVYCSADYMTYEEFKATEALNPHLSDLVECEQTARECLDRSKDKWVEWYDGGFCYRPEGDCGFDDDLHELAARAMENPNQ